MSVDTLKSSIDTDEFEIVKQGTASFAGLTATSGVGQFLSAEASTTVAHNLGYTPGLIINIMLAPNITTEIRNCPYAENPVGGVIGNFGDWFVLQAYADKTNLYLLTDLLVLNGSSIVTSSFVAQYYLLKERIKRSA